MRYASTAPMNKTIYLRDDEVPLWERARELSDNKLSPVIVSALRRYVADKEAETKPFERIVVQYADGMDHDVPKAKAFYGKWIIPPEEEYGFSIPQSPDFLNCYAVAVTAKGAAVVYSWNLNRPLGKKYNEGFSVYPDLESAALDEEVNAAACEAIVRRGVPVEELDI